MQLTLELRDVPGELAKAAARIGETGANIVQVIHQRIFTELPVQSAEVQFVPQTRGASHVREVIETLEKAGFCTRVQAGVHA